MVSQPVSRQPVIAVTATSRREAPGDPLRVRLNEAYVAAVTRAGGTAIIAPPQQGRGVTELVSIADALLLTGGEDIDPVLFGERPHPSLGRVTRERDDWEIALLAEARAARRPVLAICRGIQLLNVALGGSLVQDIPSQVPGALLHAHGAARSERTHDVTIEPTSRLHGLLGDRHRVNSMHHQAISTMAPGLRAVATAPDGVIEAVEAVDDGWWAVGVQWHPEELDGADAVLLAAFIAAAASSRDGRA